MAPSDLFKPDIEDFTYLGYLTVTGHLPKLPEDCLPPRVVLARANHGKNRGSNFLQFCAATGHYKELPKRYQHRKSILHQSKRHSLTTPLDAAINNSALHHFPVDSLESADLTFERLILIIGLRQIDCVQHLVKADHIDTPVLTYCFHKHIYAECVLRHMTAENMLGPGLCSGLATAAYAGALKKVPVSLFLGHFQQTKLLIERFKSDLLSPEMVEAYPAGEALVAHAEEWLLSLSHEVLKAAGAKKRAA